MAKAQLQDAASACAQYSCYHPRGSKLASKLYYVFRHRLVMRSEYVYGLLVVLQPKIGPTPQTP